MNAHDEVAYRLALSKGFLTEADQDVTLSRWRSCVDNSQLSVENAGKAVLAVFGVTPRTHDPARELADVLRRVSVPPAARGILASMLTDLLALGRRSTS